MESRRTILLVDDVAMFLELGALFLARTGRVITARGGEHALRLARREHPDLILADLDMPDLDGESLCREIRDDAELAQTPFIMLVGDPDPCEHARAVRAGANDVIAKPIARIELIEAVERFLDRAIPTGLPRVELAEPVKIRHADLEAPGTLRNLSRGGVYVESECSFARESEVGLRFALPHGDLEISTTARVVWHQVQKPMIGMGMRFLEIDEETRKSFGNFVFEYGPTNSRNLGAPL